MIKYYIGLSEEQPTREQYNSLLIWLDQHSKFTKIITIFGPNGEPSTNYRFTSDFISDDIVDRIRRYYISGKLYEQLDKSKDIKRQQNFTYKREMLGESLKEGDIIKLKENINWDKVQWGVHQFSTNSIIFRGTEEECAKYIDDRPELWDDAEVYFMTSDDPHYIKNQNDQELEEDLNMNKEHLKIYFNLKIDNTNSDYSDIDDDDKRNVTREGIIEFTRYKLDVADWVDSYDYDWDSDSATVEIWVDPDTKLTKEEINNKVKEWENWYYYDTITQYGEKHDHYYYEEPWYDENEADATLSFEGYEWVPDEEK